MKPGPVKQFGLRRVLKSVLFLGVILMLVLAAGCSGDPSAQDKQAGNMQGEAADPVTAVDPKPNSEEVTLNLYFADDQAMNLVLEQRTVPSEGKALGVLMIEELIKGPQKAGLHPTIPSEAKLLSLELADGVAYVNFSKEMQTKHWGGSTGELITVYSIVYTLAELPEVDRVQFLIEGKKQEAIWGHLDTMEPVDSKETGHGLGLIKNPPPEDLPSQEKAQ